MGKPSNNPNQVEKPRPVRAARRTPRHCQNEGDSKKRHLVAKYRQRTRATAKDLHWLPTYTEQPFSSSSTSMGVANRYLATYPHRFRRPICGAYIPDRGRRAFQMAKAIPMKSTTTSRTIEKLRTIFCRHGIPTQLVSDNGPPFKSEEFNHFMKSNGIKHIRSARYHPATNDLAERFEKKPQTSSSISQQRPT